MTKFQVKGNIAATLAGLSLLEKAQVYTLATARTGLLMPVRGVERSVNFAQRVIEAAVEEGCGFFDDICDDFEVSKGLMIEHMKPELAGQLLIDMETASQSEIEELLGSLGPAAIRTMQKQASIMQAAGCTKASQYAGARIGSAVMPTKRASKKHKSRR